MKNSKAATMVINILALLPYCIILTCSFAFSLQIPEGVVQAKELFFILGTGLICCLCCIPLLFVKTDILFPLHRINICAILFLLYSLAGTLWHNQSNAPFPTGVVINFCVLFFYVLTGLLLQNGTYIPSILPWLVLSTAIGHVTIGSLQFFGILQGFHVNFDVTSVFFNPAPFAIYLTVLFIIIYTLLLFHVLQKGKRWKSVLFIVILTILAFLLVILQSRSAWLGVGASFVFVTLLFIKKFRPGYFFYLKKKSIPLLLTGAPLLAAVLYLIYTLKADSANGRLLTWKITGAIIREHFLWGVGFGNFATNYSLYQYAFFKGHSENIETYGQLAGDVRYAFNDLLQIFAEGGIVGLSLFLLLIYWYFSTGVRSFMNDADNRQSQIILLSLAGIVALLTGGLFSYPLSVLPLNLLFWLLIAQGARFMSSPACAGSKVTMQPATWLKKSFSLPLIIVAFFLIHFTVCRANALYEWGRFKKLLAQKKLPGKYSTCLSPLYPTLADNSYFMISLGKALTNDSSYAKAIGILISANKITPSKEVYYTLGKAYQRTGQFQKAEMQYKFVWHAIPNLLKPSYFLTKLYFENKKWDEFKVMANKVTAFEPKFLSYESEQMIEDVYYLISISPYNH